MGNHTDPSAGSSARQVGGRYRMPATTNQWGSNFSERKTAKTENLERTILASSGGSCISLREVAGDHAQASARVANQAWGLDENRPAFDHKSPGAH